MAHDDAGDGGADDDADDDDDDDDDDVSLWTSQPIDLHTFSVARGAMSLERGTP